MRTLVVCPQVPYPPHNGGFIRILKLAEGLARHGQVDLLCLDSYGDGSAHLPALRAIFGEVHLAARPRASRLAQLPGLLRKVLRQEPFFTKYAESSDLARQLHDLAAGNAYDVIELVHSHMAIHRAALPAGCRSRLSLSMQNIAFLQFERMLRHARRPQERLKLWFTARPMRHWEPEMAARFDKIITCSDIDRALLLEQRADLDISVVPNGVDTERYQPLPRAGRRPNLLMLGSMNYGPNVDAVRQVAEEVFPLVRQRLPAVTLTIVGHAPPPDIEALARRPGIVVAGSVEDVVPFYAEAMVSVVALRSGGGTRLKILEAMALGTPVVSTSVGCEGLAVTAGENILVAETPGDFARQIERLLGEPTTWERLATAARRLVEERYDWRQLGDSLHATYAALQRETRGP